MIKLRNKIIIFLVLSILVVSGVNAIDYDEDLFNVWKRRVDLQKVFPDFYKDLDKIVNWAKGYGWKEDMSLIRYSPYKEIVDSVNYDFAICRRGNIGKIRTEKLHTQTYKIVVEDKTKVDFVKNTILNFDWLGYKDYCSSPYITKNDIWKLF